MNYIVFYKNINISNYTTINALFIVVYNEIFKNILFNFSLFMVYN